MKRLTFLLFLVLCAVIGLQAQNLTLPYIQDFSALSAGNMLSETGSPTAMVSGTLPGITSAHRAYQAGGAIRLGDVAEMGSFTTDPINAVGVRFVEVQFDAAAWIATTPSPAKLTLTYGSQSRTIDLPAIGHGWPITADDMLRYDIFFIAQTVPTPLVVSTTADSNVEPRVFIDNIKIVGNDGVPLSEGFERDVFPPNGWTVKHIRGTSDWKRVTNDDYSTMGRASAFVQWANSGHENWLITPKMYPIAGDSLTFSVKSDFVYRNSHTYLKIKVSTATNDTADFHDTPLTLSGMTTITPDTFTTYWVRHRVDLSPYADNEIYVAFQVVDTNGLSVLLDDIRGANVCVSNCAIPDSINANNITINSADISWAEMGSATSWVVQYSTYPTFEGAVQQTVTGNRSLSLSGLMWGTKYYVRIKADCSGGEYSQWANYWFRTLCSEVSTIQWVERFSDSDENNSNKPICWTRVTTCSSGEDRYPQVSNFGYEGKGLHFYTESSSSCPVLIAASPKFSYSLAGKELGFYLRNYYPSQPSTFEVGVMSDVTDSSTFVTIGSMASTKNIWAYYSLRIPNTVPATHKYLAMRARANGGTYLSYYVDNFGVYPYTCLQPINAIVKNIKATEAKISFSTTEPQTSWQYAITSNTTIVDPSTLTPTTITDSTHLITGLTANTTYRVWLRTVCSPGVFGRWTDAVVFKTDCNPLTGAVNILENFESIEEDLIPDCWSKISTRNNRPGVVERDTVNGVSTKAIRFYYSTPQYLVLPTFGVPLNTLQLDFLLAKEKKESGIFQVGYMTDKDDESTFVPVVSFNDVNYKKMLPKRVIFNDVVDNGNNRYIAFRYGKVDNEEFYSYASYWLDSVSVKLAPACLPPGQLKVTSLMPDSATITYLPLPGTTGQQYALGFASEDQPSTLPATASGGTIKLTGLTPNTKYKLWMRSECGAGTYGDWSLYPLYFITPCARQASINEDFNSLSEGTIPSCWNRLSKSMQYPFVVEPGTYDRIESKAIKFLGEMPQYLVSNELDTALNMFQLNFNLTKGHSRCGIFQVGYMSDPHDSTTFTPVASFNDNRYNISMPKTVYFKGVADNGNNRYIAFRYGNVGTVSQTDYYPYYLDDVVIEPLASCLAPTSLNISPIAGATTDSATVTFAHEASATAWQYVLAMNTKISSTPPDSLPKVNVTTDHISLSGLEKGKNYSIWLRTTSCSNDTSAWILGIFSTKYCRATPTNLDVRGIFRVKYGIAKMVDNITDQENDNYGDYSAMEGSVNRGDSVDVNVSVSVNSTEYKLCVYVDWNKDYDFDDAGERVYLKERITNGSHTYRATFAIPASVVNGKYRMRIMSTYSDPYPCYSQYGGTVEDYTLSVVDPLTCRYVKDIAASNISSSSADIAWTAGGTETSWDVVVSTTPMDTSNSVRVTSTAYNATSLAANTDYYVAVRAVCSASDKSPWIYGEFKTKATIVHLPYDQDFDGAVPEMVTWSAEENANTWSIGSAVGNGGKSMYISKDKGVTAEYSNAESHSMAYVTIDFDNSPKFAISFDWKGKGNFYGIFQTVYYHQMQVYIVPDTAKLPTTWNVTSNDPWIKTPGAYRLGNRFMQKLDWTTFQDTLPSSFAGTRKKLVFMWINTYLQPTTPTMSVDNISIVGFNCNPPSNIVLDTITTDSARIHWRKGSNETSWILEYRRASDVAWTSRTLTDTAYSFSGLMPNTDYQVRVKAVCSGGTTYSSWARYMFHTYCLPQAIGNTQVTYNFDQYIRTIPECWTRTLPYTDEIGNTSPYVKSNTNDPDNGILVFTGKANQIISTGEYIENMNNIEVEFSVFRESASKSGQLELGVVSDPRNPSTFVAVHDITPLITRDEQFERLNLSLASAPNGKHYIAFRQTVSSTDDNRQYGIDNLSIYKSPTCRKPNINTVTIEPTDDPTAKTVVVNWSAGGSESAWVLQYRERGSATWNTQNVSGMPIDTIRGLSPQTAYELRIRSICSATDSSFWTLTKSFATPCTARTLPFKEDFNSISYDFPPDCWQKYHAKASNIFGGAKFGETGGGWNYSDNIYGLNTGGKAKVNIYGTDVSSWLITPRIQLPQNSNLKFDVSLTNYESGDPASGTARSDDKFMVIISDDGGLTWSQTNATVWSNDGTGNHVMNDITNGVNQIIIPLENYAGKIVKIAFYAESTVGSGSSDADIDLHIDNIEVYEVVIKPPKVKTLEADNITDNTAHLHKILSEGDMEVTSHGFFYRADNEGARWQPTTDSIITGLIRGTVYKFYAYAEADNKIYRGDTLSFTTTGAAPIHPIVTTQPATGVSQNSATLKKSVVGDTSEPVLTEGWKWHKVGESNWYMSSDGLLNTLEHSTQYEFYAYATTAINSDGYKGATLQFTTTSHTPPTVKTLAATAIGTYAATLRKVVTIGTEPILEEGWYYKKSSETDWQKTSNANLTGLGINTEYQFYAYAITKSYPMTKGEILTFKTLKTTDLDEASYGANIYPNPAHTVVNVDVPSLSGAAEVTVVDMMGKTVGRYVIADGNNSISIDVSSFAEGVYTVRIVSDSITLVERLVIKKR